MMAGQSAPSVGAGCSLEGGLAFALEREAIEAPVLLPAVRVELPRVGKLVVAEVADVPLSFLALGGRRWRVGRGCWCGGDASLGSLARRGMRRERRRRGLVGTRRCGLGRCIAGEGAVRVSAADSTRAPEEAGKRTLGLDARALVAACRGGLEEQAVGHRRPARRRLPREVPPPRLREQRAAGDVPLEGERILVAGVRARRQALEQAVLGAFDLVHCERTRQRARKAAVSARAPSRRERRDDEPGLNAPSSLTNNRISVQWSRRSCRLRVE